jgi:hypothetical protein
MEIKIINKLIKKWILKLHTEIFNPVRFPFLPDQEYHPKIAIKK